MTRTDVKLKNFEANAIYNNFILNKLPGHGKHYSYTLSKFSSLSRYFLSLDYYSNSVVYSKTCVKRPLSKRPKKGIKPNYRLMQVKSIAEHSAILSTFIKLPVAIKIFV